MKTYRYTFLKRAAASAVVLTLGFGHLHAAVIFDSLSAPGAGTSLVKAEGDPSPYYSSPAAGFKTDASATLGSVVLNLEGDDKGRLRVLTMERCHSSICLADAGKRIVHRSRALGMGGDELRRAGGCLDGEAPVHAGPGVAVRLG